jgi:hypothetical protein
MGEIWPIQIVICRVGVIWLRRQEVLSSAILWLFDVYKLRNTEWKFKNLLAEYASIDLK